MKIRYLIFALLFCFTIPSHAQIFDKLTKSIDTALDGAIDDVTAKLSEQMVERIIEKIFSGEAVSQDSFPGSSGSASSSSDSTGTNSSFDLGSIFGGGVDKTKVFNFSHRMKMEIQSNGEEAQVFDYYFNETESYIGMEIQSMFVILELETEKTYAITNGSVISMNLKSIVDKMTPQGTDAETGYTKITKTGRKEEIVGFMCEEYDAETEDGFANIWVTENFFNQNIEDTAFIQNVRDNANTTNVKGAFMRYKFYEKGKEDEVTTMNVIEFVPQAKTIDFKDY
jgi:hypothetical protein